MGYSFAGMGPALHVVALVALFLFLAIIVAVVAYLANLPGKIAAERGHPQAEAIQVCGWVGVVTVFFWIVALVWAYVKPAGTTGETASTPSTASLADQVARLEQMTAAIESGRKGAVQ